MKRILIILMVIVMILDFSFTLLGQPIEYLENYQLVSEGSPMGKLLLPVHPLAFISVFIFWVFLAIYLVRILKPPWDIMFGTGVILGHFHGSIAWVPHLFIFLKPEWLGIQAWHWYSSVIFIIFLAFLFGLIIHKIGSKKVALDTLFLFVIV